MAKTNYTFEKRQRELAKKKKKEEKRLKKQAATAGNDQSDQSDQSQSDNDATDIDIHVWPRRKTISLLPLRRSGDFHMGFQLFHRKQLR